MVHFVSYTLVLLFCVLLLFGHIHIWFIFKLVHFHQALIGAEPFESVAFVPAGSIDNGRGGSDPIEERTVTGVRSASEQGSAWSTDAEVQQAVHHLQGATSTTSSSSEQSPRNTSSSSSSLLCAAWSRLVVRVMSARNHDFGNAVANSFYKQEVGELN